MEFTHFDDHGNAIMVDVSDKEVTKRTAVALGIISLGRDAFEAVLQKKVKKGDVLAVARVAGIMAVKQTSGLIPMCHPLMITNCSIDFNLLHDQDSIEVICTAKVTGKTGIEMEALTGASIALLTIYDMCKAINKHMVITEVKLLEKTGGKTTVTKREVNG